MQDEADQKTVRIEHLAKYIDAAHSDAGHSDAAHNDAGHNDAAHSDAGHNDAGHNDAGHNDAGHSDAGHNDAILTLASWILEEWGRSFLEATFEELVSELERRTTRRRIPETLVALEGDRLVGTASIVEHDMSTYLELSPWLSAVYVAPEFRSRGIGSKLVRRLVQEAEILGVKRLYLFTPDRMRFYARLGWNILEQTRYHGEDVVIMQYEVEAP